VMAVLAVAGCGQPGSGGPVPTPRPRSASLFPDGTCGDPSPTPSGEQDAPAPPWADLVTVTRNPRSLLANWFPGINAGPSGRGGTFQGPCKTVRTTASRAVARRIAHDIDTAPAVPSGTFNCPNDSGAAVDLYFQLPSGGWQPVRVTLSGCAGVGGLNSRARQLTLPLATDLDALAPPPWR
jgi:hypothetical protein